MPTVVFEAAGGDGVEVDVPGGAALVDVCDEQGAPVPFSCRSASCGTCRVAVLEGAALLDPPTEEELSVLDAFGDDPTRTRLACQARLSVSAEGRLRLRPEE